MNEKVSGILNLWQIWEIYQNVKRKTW